MNYKSISLISGTLLLSTLSANGQKKDSKPNIIFILCDDMGYGDLGCYGQPFIRTPHIDAMASEGMRFTQAYAGSPVSAPSRASFMTGQHTGHCEVRGNKEYWGNSPIIMYGNNKEYSVVGQHPYDPDHVILPEIMKDNGYTTGMFGKWAGGYEGSCSTPDKRGIDEYYGYICQFQAHLYYPNFLNRYSKALGDTGVVRIVMDENIKYPMYGPEYQKRSQYSADMIHKKAMEWLDQQDTKQPFFGIFTYTLPHAELVQPEDSILNEYKAKFDPDKVYKGSEGSRYNAITHTHAQFAAMITRLDYYVGEVLKKLKEKGLDENTLVIFSSDNGPVLDDGYKDFAVRDNATHSPAGPFRAGKYSILEGGSRIPFIVKWPGVVKPGATSKALFNQMDLAASLEQLLEPGKANSFRDSENVIPALLGKSAKGRDYHVINSTGKALAIRHGKWKFIPAGVAIRDGINGLGAKMTKSPEGGSLFDLEKDPKELNNVAAQHPDICEQMKAKLQEIRQRPETKADRADLLPLDD